MVLELLPVIHAHLSAQHVERRLVRFVLVRLGASAGRDGEQLHMDGRRACGLGGNRSRVGEALLADERFARAQANAGGGTFGGHAIGHDGLLAGSPRRPVPITEIRPRWFAPEGANPCSAVDL
jgi:hypothetical protein